MSDSPERRPPRVAFVQPFGVADAGGGAKVLRSLLRNAPVNAFSVNAGLIAGPPTDLISEFHLPPRPHFGRAEYTRLSRFIQSSNRWFAGGFRQKLAALLEHQGATAVHAIAHGWESLDAFQVARELHLPFLLTAHDDLLYALLGQFGLTTAERLLAEAWTHADIRFAISEELGAEYCRRYGKRQFIIVTDGLDSVIAAPYPRRPRQLNVYFMGLLHQSYRKNFDQLIQALDRIARENPEWQVLLTTRGAPAGAIAPGQRVRVNALPFVPESQTIEDMKNADLMYVPLPFEPSDDALVRYSLSTKMISYLGSGRPILYHGPAHAAACTLLEKHGAGQIVSETGVDALVSGCYELLQHYDTLAAAGLTLAKRRFLLQGIRERFWGAVSEVMGADIDAREKCGAGGRKS